MSSETITYKTGHERADWLSVYRDRQRFWADTLSDQNTVHANACADADRAIRAMRDRDPRPSQGVSRG